MGLLVVEVGVVREFFVPLRPVTNSRWAKKQSKHKKQLKAAKPLPRTPLVKVQVVTTEASATTKQASVPELTKAEKHQAALDLRLQGYSLKDIGLALGMTDAWVSNALKQMLQEIHDQTRASAEQLRALELERLDRLLISQWPMRMSGKATETILKILERRHKLSGLEVTKTEWTGANGGPIQITAANLDITKLNDEELQWLEIIIQKAAPKLPATPTDAFQGLPALEGECTPVTPTTPRVTLHADSR